jgi:aldehyde dehydrogenase (NAD+)
MSASSQQTPAYVAGEWITSPDGIDVYDPATGELVAGVPRLTSEHAAAALEAARRGAAEWARTSLLTRGQVLLQTARLLRENAARIAELIVRENGKTLTEATGEVEKSAQFFEYYGGMARDPYGYLLADARPNSRAEARYEPVGAVLIVTPWNDPLLTPARKLAPALLTGNAVIFKPASETPLGALELTRIFLEAGLPAEAISTLTGRGGEIVDPLLESRGGIGAVSFTGSTAIGLQLQRKLAGSNVRVQTEMGGKNAVVVMEDADLDLAVDTVIAGAFGQSGQRCTATSRVLVAAEIADEFGARLAGAVSSLRVGSGLDASTQVGPLVSQGQRDSVVGFIERAEQAGGVVQARGELSESLPANGCYVAPTLVGNVAADSELWTDEVFGPVVALRSFATLDEAIEAVNASAYGLSAAIFTRSLSSSTTFTDRVEAGQVSVNLPTSGWDIHHPFGGFKDSGSGYKEQGTEVLNFYTRVKTVAIRSA